MYSTWSKKCVADIWNKSSDNYHLFHRGRDKLASFECSFNLSIIIVTHCGCLWSAGWGCTGFWMCVRPRWWSALCCCSSRPAARGSTGDARYPPVIWRSSGRSTRAERQEEHNRCEENSEKRSCGGNIFSVSYYFTSLSKCVQSNPIIENNAVTFRFDLFVNLLKPQSHMS